MAFKFLTFCALLALSEGVRVLHTNVDYHQYEQASAPVLLKKVKKPEGQDLSKVAGIAGHDYPIYHEFPETSFDCKDVPAHPGIYANVETGCQGYHVCNDGREGPQGSKFLCTNGTLFSQKLFTCDHWYNVDCGEAQHYYQLNVDPEENPYTKDQLKKNRELDAQQQQHQQQHY